MLHRHCGKYFLKMILKLGSSISKCVTLKMTACSRLSITTYFIPFDGQMLGNRAANGFAVIMKDSLFFFRSHCECGHLPALPYQAPLTALNPSRLFLYRLYWNRSAAEGGGLKWVASLHLLSPIHHLFSLGCIAAVSFSVTLRLSGLRGVSILAIHSIAFPLWPRREIHPRFFCALPNTQFPVRVDVPLVCGLPSAWGGRRYSSQEKKPYPMWKSKPLYIAARKLKRDIPHVVVYIL